MQNLQLLHTIPGVGGAYIADAKGAVLESTLPAEYPHEALVVVAQKVIQIFASGEESIEELNSMLLKCSVIFLYAQKLNDRFLIVLCEQNADVAGLKVAGGMIAKLLA